MDTLLTLPAETRIHPGHTDPTTVADELETNLVRADLARPRSRGRPPVRRAGEPATLILLGDDYDGGHKAWVRWPDGQRRHRSGIAASSLAVAQRPGTA